MIPGIFIRLLSTGFFTISNMLWKVILYTHENYIIIFYRTLVSAGLLGLAIPAYQIYTGNKYDGYWLKDLSAVTAGDWIFAILLCLFSFWGLYFYTAGLKLGRFSLIAPVTSINAVFSFITAVLVFSENLTWNFYLALVFSLAGIVIHQWNQFKQLRFSREVLFAILSSLFWGVSFALFLISIQKFGILMFSLILECCVLASSMFLIWWHWKSPAIFKVGKRGIIISLCIGSAVVGGVVSSNIALTEMPVSINILINFIVGIVSIAYGIIFHKEKLNGTDWLLIVLISSGAMFLFL